MRELLSLRRDEAPIIGERLIAAVGLVEFVETLARPFVLVA